MQNLDRIAVKTLRFCRRLQQFPGVHATCNGPEIKRWRGFAVFRRADYPVESGHLLNAAYNLRWLLRAVVRGRIGRLFFALCSAALQLLLAVSVTLLPSRQRSTSVVAAAG